MPRLSIRSERRRQTFRVSEHQVKQKPLRPTDFSPHPHDAFSVGALAELRTCFRLNPRGRVWSVFTSNAFGDAHVSHLFGLAELIEFNRAQFVGQESHFTDDGFREMATHPRLQAFMDNNNPNITDESAAAVSESTNLRWVNFPNCAITDAGVKHLSKSNRLLALSLIANNITDACVPDLCRLTNLRRLSLGNTQISEESIALLKSSLDRCRVNPKWKPDS